MSTVGNASRPLRRGAPPGATPPTGATPTGVIATATVATLTSSGAMPWQWQGTLVTTGIERRLGILP